MPTKQGIYMRKGSVSLGRIAYELEDSIMHYYNSAGSLADIDRHRQSDWSYVDLAIVLGWVGLSVFAAQC